MKRKCIYRHNSNLETGVLAKLVKKMHPITELKSICRIFAWMGLSSVQPYFRENSSLHNILLCIPTFVQIIIISIESFTVFAYPNEFYHNVTNVGAFTDAVQIGGLLLSGIVQIAENYWKSGIDQSIKESIGEFDREIFEIHSCRNQWNCLFSEERSIKSFLIGQTIYLFFVPIIIHIAILLTLPNSERIWIQSIYVREFTVHMIRIGLIQILCHFHWVRFYTDSEFWFYEKCLIARE